MNATEIPTAIAALGDQQRGLSLLLESWANINSGSSNGAGLGRMYAALVAEFATLPGATLKTVTLPATKARVLRLSVRPEAPVQILFSGHYDTVYPAEHAFQSCTLLDPETLRGPGVCDMKGGIVVMLAALRAFARTPHAQQVGYEVIITPDEETGSAHSRALLESVARSGRHTCALVFEPARANGDLVRSRKGTGVFTVTIHGRAAHAGRDPGAGRNAILALAEILPQLDAIAHDLPGVLINIGTVRGGGTVNMVPDLATAELNVRVTRTGDDQAFLQRVGAILDQLNEREGYRAELSGRFNRKPKVVTPFEERLFAEWQKGGQELGLTFSWQDVGGGSDGNLLSAAGLDTLDGLGPVGDYLHSAEEFVHLPSLTERAQLVALFLHRLAAGEINLN